MQRSVIAAMNTYYTDHPACGGRGSHHWFAREVTARIEGDAERGISGTRQKLADFIHASWAQQILFTANTNQAISLVVPGLKFRIEDRSCSA